MSRCDLNILYVTSHCPHAHSYGAQIRVLNIGRLLKRLGRVSLVIASSEDIDQKSLDRTRAEFDVRHIVRVRPDPIKNCRDRMRFELDPFFLNTYFSAVSEYDQGIVLRMVRDYDVVWVHTTRTANDFRIYRWPHSVLDIDDIQSRLYAYRAKADSGIIRSLLDYRMSVIWWRRERLLKNRFDVLAVCSQSDRKYLGEDSRIHVIPNGFTASSQLANRAPNVMPRLGFIGSFGFMPNRDGIEWFIQKVWPSIKRVAPETRLRLVGQGSDNGFPMMGPDIDGLGFVKDTNDEIATWSAMIVPIRFGGGTRIKIAEAFSRRCPVVSTSVGAFGYEVVNGEDLLLADREEDFAAACLHFTGNPESGARISENAWEKFSRNWTWDSIGGSVTQAVEDCIAKNERNETRRCLSVRDREGNRSEVQQGFPG